MGLFKIPQMSKMFRHVRSIAELHTNSKRNYYPSLKLFYSMCVTYFIVYCFVLVWSVHLVFTFDKYSYRLYLILLCVQNTKPKVQSSLFVWI